MEKYQNIIWDWNGTLLDDTLWNYNVINEMLLKRKLKALSKEEYLNVFSFPLFDFYKKIGFDFQKEDWEEAAKEFIKFYHKSWFVNCKLHDGALEVLEKIKTSNKSQIILSASNKEILLQQAKECLVTDYFAEILGLADIYAKSKIEMGLEYIKRKGKEKTVLIGDTIHDYEVSQSLEIDCILIANGHQSKERLLSCENALVIDNMRDLLKLNLI